jgi:hypothetical protein
MYASNSNLITKTIANIAINKNSHTIPAFTKSTKSISLLLLFPFKLLAVVTKSPSEYSAANGTLGFLLRTDCHLHHLS